MSIQENMYNACFSVPPAMLLETDLSTLEYYPKLFHGAPMPKHRFEVYFDVQDYGPEDIRVKTVDGFVVVKGKHQEKRENYGWVQRKFQRRCPLPKGFTTEALLSQYSTDGMLTISANLVKIDEAKCDVPVEKKEDGQENTEPDQPKPDADGDQSEKKPVKPKSKEGMVEVKVEKENKPFFTLDYSLEKFLRDSKIEE